MVNYNRPLGIPLMVYLLWALAFFMIAIAVYVLYYGGKFWHDGILQYIESEEQRLLAIIFFSILILISGIGMLKTSPTSRGLLVALCIITGIHGILVMLSDFVRGFSIIIIALVIIGYLFTYGVSSAFQPMDSRKAVDAIEALESYKKSRLFR